RLRLVSWPAWSGFQHRPRHDRRYDVRQRVLGSVGHLPRPPGDEAIRTHEHGAGWRDAVAVREAAHHTSCIGEIAPRTDQVAVHHHAVELRACEAGGLAPRMAFGP